MPETSGFGELSRKAGTSKDLRLLDGIRRRPLGRRASVNDGALVAVW